MIPKEIRLHQRSATLEIEFEDGRTRTLTAEFLRVMSPSAEVKGHTAEQAVLQHGKKEVRITGVEPQGNYALKLTFSDGHDTGIYSWAYLDELGANHDTLWAEYLEKLEKAGKSRQSQFIAVSR